MLTELFDRELFLTLKLYLHLTKLLHISAWMFEIEGFLNCVLMLNWIVLNRTDLHKTGFGVKYPTKVDMP